ncbi:MAG: hypothetical protein Q7W45_04020 [Bacteroidota bacterium]|nr:hypothetical protein [Bacteroidota bacterium]MDP3144613.1 hypothetical protein [Bacteroidota bacterium]MDP3556552.1 hypothetical protein [Bacteroidota bacterium]
MKKKVLIITTLFSAMLTYAQEPKTDGAHCVKCACDEEVLNKKGHEILPVKGDIALGFNTIPVLDMFLGTLNRATPFAGSSNVVSYVQASNNQIVGKYYLDAKTAIRGRVGFNTLSGSMVSQVQDAAVMFEATKGTQDDINAASLIRVDDKLKFSKNNVLITVGYEKRRGYRRLQGFYGGEIGFGTNGSKQSVEYGNKFSDQYPVQFTNNFNSFGVTTVNPIAAGRTVRNLESKNRGGIRFGVRGFIGIEYFIFSKISIGAEYGWGYSLTTRRGQTSTQEVYNNGQKGPEVLIEEVDVDSSEKLKGFSVDNNNGSIFSMNNTLGGNTALSGGAGALTLIFHF